MNVFDVVAKITLDTSDYNNGLDKAESATNSFGQKLGSGLKTAAKIGVAAIGTASAGITALTKQAVDGFADYEQLVGGVETLFGDSAQKVITDADAAFRTAGMSANDYMETSIQSAAALINSLGGDQAKAADLMNMSITDMADNVNKMGTSMEGVQNAYRGFSRGNFTMLDNLALGFAGTKDGMQELLDKAKEFSGIEYDIDSYSDIVQAIHVVQTEMGIAGTTAKEASGTISGSVAAMKSAWDNLVVGIANNNADLDSLINNLVDSAEIAFQNILPVAEKAITGIANLVEKIAPIVVDKLPGLALKILPPLLNAATQLINALVLSLPSLFQVIIDQIPMLMNMLVPAFINLLPQIIDLGLELVLALATGIADAIPDLMPTIVDVVISIADKLTDPNTLSKILVAALQIMVALANGLIDAIPKLLAAVPKIIGNLVSAIGSLFPQILAVGISLVVSLASGILQAIPELYAAAPSVISAIADGLGKGIGEIVKVGENIVDGLWNGIRNSWGTLVDNAKDLASGLVKNIKGLFGIHSPSTVFAEIGENLDKGLALGIKDNRKLITDTATYAFDLSDSVSGIENESIFGRTVGQTQNETKNTGDIIIPVYIGQSRIDEIIVRANQINNYVTGGRG